MQRSFSNRMTKNYCVIGYPIAHSLSPTIHSALYGIYGLDCRYVSYPVDHDSIQDFIAQIEKRDIQGFNITMPLKQDIIPYLKTVAEDAKDGVNTVVVSPDGLHGYSTDAQGFLSSLHTSGADYTGADIVFIGSGAVTNLLCTDAAKKGARQITIVNRTLEKAKKIAAKCGGRADRLSNISQYMPTCDLLVNTTPLGMSGQAYDFPDLSFIDLLPSHAVVCDLIYSPPQTSLLRHAAARGLKSKNGLGMLIWQAFYAFEKFCGILPTGQDYHTVLKKLDLTD